MGISVNEAGHRGGISKSKPKEKAARKNGQKGGAPQGNQNAKKK